MPIPSAHDSVSQRLFAPLTELLPSLKASRICPELSDADFLQLGVSRVLSQAKSGRDFLFSHETAGGRSVEVSHFFATLQSPRREAFCVEANQKLAGLLTQRRPDPFACLAELAGYALYAGDGHYQQAAAHDERIEEAKHPIPHFFLLNLRSCALQHLTVGLRDAATERKSEHDMHALKRCDLATLRMGAPKGEKVMIIWDRAGIDFRYWQTAKGMGIYFVSREKDNMKLEVVGVNVIDSSLACNDGVLRDELVATSQGVMVRRIVYKDCVGGVEYSYLTINLQLAPGLLVLLYKRRWDIEKVFDETENRLQEGKAWASSLTAKSIQGQLICIAYNLCLLMETTLEQDEQIKNLPELKRRAQRQAVVQAQLHAQGLKLPFVYRVFDRLTQRGVKLLRWIRNHLYSPRPWVEALLLLRKAYVRL